MNEQDLKYLETLKEEIKKGIEQTEISKEALIQRFIERYRNGEKYERLLILKFDKFLLDLKELNVEINHEITQLMRNN